MIPYSKGIIRYDSEKDKVERIGGTWEYISDFSIGGKKITFFDEIRKKRWYGILRISNTDGSQDEVLLDSREPDSPFYRLDIQRNCLLSADGRRVAFVTRQYSTPYIRRRRSEEDIYKIWWMNTDGSGLKEQVLNFPISYFYDRLFAWPSSSDNIFLGVEERSKTFKKIAYKILKVDLENGNRETLFEDMGSPYRLRVSPGQNYLATVIWEEKGTIVLVNLRTFEKKSCLRI